MKDIADQMRRDHFLQYCASIDPMLSHQYQLQQYQHGTGLPVAGSHQQAFHTENQN